MKLVKILVLASLVISQFAFADDYKTAQRFKDGDVMSADVLNDILDRIELALKPIERDELVGVWSAVQYFCGRISSDPTDISGSDGCDTNGEMTGGNYDSGFAYIRSDTATISAVEDDANAFDVSFGSFNMLFNHAFALQSFQKINSSVTHRCSIIDGAAILGCAQDSSIINDGKRLSSYYNVQRLSGTKIKLFWGPVRGGGLFNTVILDKNGLPASAPTSLELAAQSGSIALSWTAGDTTATGYDIQRKTTFDGTYASIGTGTDVGFTDLSVTAGTTYWYRVFATNANGTSIGSNVVKLTYVEATEEAVTEVEATE